MKSIFIHLVVLLCVIGIGSELRALEIVAHRGASAVAPENTVASIKKAWELKAESTEIDIYLTSDEKIVVIHDESTKRTGGTDLWVASSTFDDLRKLDVGSFKGPEYRGEKIPLLEEVLALIHPGKKLYIEIKCDSSVLPFLKPILEKSGKMQRFVIIGFDNQVVAKAKEMFPSIPVFWLIEPEKDPKTGKFLPYDGAIIQKAREQHLDGFGPYHKGLTRSFVQGVHQAGMKVFVWTVDRAADAGKLEKLGVDGIITNRPDFIRKSLEGK